MQVKKKNKRDQQDNHKKYTPHTILVVEDNEDLLYLIQKNLQHAGFCTRGALDGSAAVASAINNQNTLMLLDYQLPDMTGLEVTQILAQQRVSVPFIVLTGHGNEKVAVEMMKLGARDYVIKETGFLDLLPSKVKQVIDKLEMEKKLQEAEILLRESESKYRSLFENMLNGFAYHKIVVNKKNQPIDYIFLEVNDAFEELTGLKKDDIVGKRVTEVLPQIKDSVFDWIGEYGKVALTGNKIKFERFCDPLGRWYSISAFSPNNGFFVTIFEDISERKQVEQQLRLQVTALESAANGIIITELDGTIIWVNCAFTKLTGYTCEEVLGQNPRILKSGKYDQLYYKEIWDTILSGKVWQGEIINRRKDGSLYTEEMTVTPVRDECGKITNFIAIKQDITERKRAGRALIESENRYKRLLESVTDYIYTVKVEHGQPLSTSHGPNCVAVTGYTSQEYDADPNLWYRMVHEEDRNAVTEQATRLVSGEVAPPLEHRIIHKDGSIRWVKNIPVPRYDDQGHLIAYDGLVSDITERKQVEAALRESEERFRTIADFTYSWEYWISPQGSYIYVSPACERISGYRADEFLQDSELLKKITYPDDQEIITGHIYDELNSAKVLSLSYRILSRDGDVRWISHVCQPVYSENGRQLGRRASNRDITERKQAEEQITNSLREKEVLLKEVHHRVKNNLQVISSLLNLQSKYIKDNHTLELFKDTQNRVKSMALIHEKLYQSKDLNKIDFAGYIQNLVAHLFRSYGVGSNSIELCSKIDDVMLDVNTAILLGLIINELVSNSLKHAFPAMTVADRTRNVGNEISNHKGKICIDLQEIKNVKSKKSYAPKYTLIISDNGIGLPKDLDFRTTESLGLQLVNTLIKQLGAALECKRNKGTKVKINFTISQEKERT